MLRRGSAGFAGRVLQGFGSECFAYFRMKVVLPLFFCMVLILQFVLICFFVAVSKVRALRQVLKVIISPVSVSLMV